MYAMLILGAVLLALGTGFRVFDINLFPNNKAIIGLSFIPLSVAFTYYSKISRIKKHPDEMKIVIISEGDERLVALRNEADAKALKILQGALFLTYMGYTLMIPEDIFESAGWWLIMILLFFSFLSRVIMSTIVMRKANSRDDEEN